MKIPYSIIFAKPFAVIGDNLKSFFKIAAIYSAILTVMAYFLGSTYACMYAQDAKSFFPCYETGWQTISYQIIKILFVASFIKNWVNTSAKGDKKIVFIPQKQDVRIIGALFSIIGICLLPLISFIVLYIRVPNPNWQIEMAFFTFVSIGFVIPFLLLRFLPLIGDALKGEKIKNIKDVWSKTSESGFRLLFFVMTFLILVAFLQLNLMQSFESIKNNFTIVNVFFVDFVYDITTLLLLAIFVNHCIIIRDFIKGDK